jgi:hypothetical protein
METIIHQSFSCADFAFAGYMMLLLETAATAIICAIVLVIIGTIHAKRVFLVSDLCWLFLSPDTSTNQRQGTHVLRELFQLLLKH